MASSQWYYNTESGELTHSAAGLTGFFTSLGFESEQLFGGAGWHELNIPGTSTEAQAAAAAVKEFPKGTPPTTSVKTGESNAVSQEVTGSASGLAGLGQIGAFFGTLTQAATWIRVAEGLLGIILIAVGLAHMTKVVPLATKIAAVVP
jgi:hypothetical protein